MALAGLLAACVVMFGAAFGTGCAAIGGVAAAVADEAALGVLSAFGAGLLCSTALSIVIPEGFHALADSHHAHSALPSWAPGAALAAGFFVMQILDLGASCDHGCGRDAPPPTSPLAPSPLPRWAPSPAPFHTPTANPLLLLTGRDAASSALTAMVVHAAADGLAVGAACAGGSAAAELLVLVAMVVHKAPAALGLASTLAAARWPADKARTGLALFAGASPAAALAAYAVLARAPAGATPGGVALALLFSGGTLVYASCVHVLPAAAKGGRGGLAGARGGALAAGALAPLVLSALMPHSH